MSHNVESSDLTYIHSPRPTQARLYKPEGVERPPLAIDIHGGAWNFGDRLSGAHYDQALARAGIAVLAIDFRHAPEFRHPAASHDIANAIRFAREQGSALGCDAAQVGLIGSSSGGHLALLAGLAPLALATGESSSSAADYVIALWPVSDPLYRFHYAQRAGMTRLVEAGLAYFGDEDSMRAASVTRVLREGEATRLPPALVVQPGNDGNVPREMTMGMVSAWQDCGGEIETAFFPGEQHGFGHQASSASDRMVVLMADFIRRTLTR